MGQDFDASARQDRAWVLKARKGKTSAFDRLVLKYQKPVYFLALKMVGNPPDAEDIVQDTFVRAYRSLDRFDPKRPFQPWLYRIALNLALTTIERRKRHQTVAYDDALEVADANAPNPTELKADDIGKLAVKAAQALPEDQRAVLLLRIQQNLSYDQIAQILDIPPGTVMSRLNRARTKLRKLLKDYL
jgi:RNA polymerase sigma-70 factor (ECF subfamily)